MTVRRALAVATVSSLLVLEAGAGASAAEPDPTYPTGTFTLDRTSTYAFQPDGDILGTSPAVVVTRSAVTDDETTPDYIQVVMYPGDGSDPQDWNPQWCPGATCQLQFYRLGTFTPKVSLTDGDGNTTTVSLPAVTVRRDSFAPVVRLTKPRPRLRHRVSAWRVLRGTAVDRGVGVRVILATVMQKRRGRWYSYTDIDQRWRKGLRTEAATYKKFTPQSHTTPATEDGARWHTPRIRGLTRGPLVVRVYADDGNINISRTRVVARVRLTRR